MNIKQLFGDDRAVSPVIGVILMVAITVILAAVIGTFVLGLGSGLNQAPQVQMDIAYTESGTNDYTVNITHQGGAQLSADSISVSGSEGSTIDLVGSGPYTAGDALVNSSSTNRTVNAGETVQVVWSSPDGSGSQIIGESTAPSN